MVKLPTDCDISKHFTHFLSQFVFSTFHCLRRPTYNPDSQYLRKARDDDEFVDSSISPLVRPLVRQSIRPSDRPSVSSSDRPSVRQFVRQFVSSFWAKNTVTSQPLKQPDSGMHRWHLRVLLFRRFSSFENERDSKVKTLLLFSRPGRRKENTAGRDRLRLTRGGGRQ